MSYRIRDIVATASAFEAGDPGSSHGTGHTKYFKNGGKASPLGVHDTEIPLRLISRCQDKLYL